MISESPVVTVHIPPPLRPYVDGHEEVTASGDTVGEVLLAVGHEYPAFRHKVLAAGGGLLAGFAIYLGPTSVRRLEGLATPVQMEELVSIVPTSEAD
ncbi:MAG: molybdopterin synthase sulfur carrier subunit [Betaproteobacteria bacterium HGW-Betaproteobacteria-10]|nr:MAG: molybdopterin synthase sulfur carrier subunit [Betaproteobacteria bacterium HGW-Betaproteobacteria-10]